MLGLDPHTVLELIRTKKLRAAKPNGTWSIPRSELVRYARIRWADRPVALARALDRHPKSGHILAVTEDRGVRELLARHRPLYISSLFGLAQSMMITPSWMVIVDWDAVGSDNAADVVERVSLIPDRPLMVGVMTEHSTPPRRTKAAKWDNLIPRPGHIGHLEDLLRRSRQISELSKS